MLDVFKWCVKFIYLIKNNKNKVYLEPGFFHSDRSDVVPFPVRHLAEDLSLVSGWLGRRVAGRPVHGNLLNDNGSRESLIVSTQRFISTQRFRFLYFVFCFCKGSCDMLIPQ